MNLPFYRKRERNPFLYMFSAISSLKPKKYVKINPKVYATTNPRKYNKYLLSAINGIKDNPDTPIPSEAVFITAWNAPPTAAPKHAVINGFPSGNVTPYNNGSPFNYVTKSFIFCFYINRNRCSYLPSASHCEYR